MKNITEFAVKHWQFTCIVFTMTLLVGVNALLTMPRNEDPEFEAPIFPIVAIYPGTTVQDMEKLVVEPIERQITQLDGINRVTTTINDGLAVIFVKFNFEADKETKNQEVIRELEALRKTLPQDISSIEVKKISDINILQIALVSEVAGYKELNTQAEELKKRLEKIKSLKSVEYWGCPERTIRIALNAERMSQLKINPNQLVGILQSDNLNIPSGSINLGTRKFNIQTKGEFKDLKDIENTIIRSSGNKVIHLKDIADVGYAYDEPMHITRLNGERCIFVTASLKNGENISSVERIYNPIIETFSESLPKTIRLEKHFDQAENVSKRLGRLGKDFFIAILIVLVTILPIGRRASYIVMISIPLSLAIGLVLLALFGFTINQLSIVGLVISLTMLVDDSIIVVENIERWRREGFSKTEAAIKATRQITMAVTGCTILVVIAFLPIALMPGEAGAFIKSLPAVIIFTILASLLVSLTIIPYLSTILLPKEVKPEGNKILAVMHQVIHLTYSRLLVKALKHPRNTLIIAGMLFAGAILLIPELGFNLFPKSERPQFLINIESEHGSNIYETDRVTKELETILSRHHIVEYYATNVGKGNVKIYYNENPRNESPLYAQLFVQLEENTSPATKTAFIDSLRKQTGNLHYAKIEIKDFEQGLPLEAPVAVRLYHNNQDSLRMLSMKVEDLLKETEGLIYVNNPLKNLKTDIRLNINRDKAAMLGVMNADIDKSVRMSLAGLDVGKMTDRDENEYKIKLTVSRKEVADYGVLKNIQVPSLSGTLIPVTSFTNIEFETSPVQISRLDKSRYCVVTAHVKSGYLVNDINNRLEKELATANFMKGQNYVIAGEKENTSDSFRGFGIIILIALAAFVSILILEFKTFKSLLIVLSVIPLGVIGAVLMLLIFGQPLSFVSIIGLIALAGIEIKATILMVDFINRLRLQGMELESAIIKAGEIRFVPILLTAFTAIFGLTPLVLEFSPLYSPLALVIIGGLISSTLLSRIITPVMYKLLTPKAQTNL